MRSSTDRRSFLARLAAGCTTLLLLFAISSTGMASVVPEIFACGTYKVDLTALAGSPCLPLSVHTVWGTAPAIWPAFAQYASPGIFIESPAVPPGIPLTHVEVCGQILPLPFGQKSVFCGNCKLCVVTCFPSGCLVIKIYPGTCPLGLLPCP
jgi:hypothetical protein